MGDRRVTSEGSRAISGGRQGNLMMSVKTDPLGKQVLRWCDVWKTLLLETLFQVRAALCNRPKHE
ncbi:MAG: hypothetical protein BCS36_12670 [Desulfovibrio sp. MES5]|nr:MAG: hypothetical protein BCS36_12670 [Desulfovibrio sp. MES5]